MVKARRAAHRAVHARRDRLCQGLLERGFRCFLDRMEADPAGGWLLHFFVADEAALTLLDELTEAVCGPGDALSFDAEEFVLQRIRYLIEKDTHSCVRVTNIPLPELESVIPFLHAHEHSHL
ncbi:MAG: hypothetical protein ACLPKW_06330 [Acetobacteraceae bacterium]